MWHKNLLSEEGTGINIYDNLKLVNETFFRERENAINYYQNLVGRQLMVERETAEVTIIQYWVESNGNA
jgi:uncharacterized protein YqeY